jgi:hypothetical protein
MKQVTELQSLEGCAAIQWQLSELADREGVEAGDASFLPAELHLHLDTCEECAHFARLWLEGAGEPLAALKEQPAAPSLRLGNAIKQQLDAGVSGNVLVDVPFRTRNAVWLDLLSKIAATVAIGAFAFWLLKPSIVHQSSKHTAEAPASKALVQTFSAVERPMMHEREALRHAAIQGGDALRKTIHTSLVIFE